MIVISWHWGFNGGSRPIAHRSRECDNCSKVKYSRGTVDKSRDNSLFQETSYFEYCSESRNFLIFLEKVYTFKSLRFCGIDFQR